MLVTNFVKEVYLILVQEQGGSNTVDRGVSPALISG